MKKKLLITTALVAAFTATNAYTMEINTDTEITGEGQAIEPNEKLIVSGGKLVATDTHVYAEGVEVTGGTVILNDGASLKNDNWDESFKLSGGTIIMNGGGDGPSIGTNHSSEEESWEYRGGKFEMTGGNLIVNDSENYIEGGDVSISAGTVDIAEGATLQTAATLIPSGLSPEEGDDAMAGEVAVIKLTDEGTIMEETLNKTAIKLEIATLRGLISGNADSENIKKVCFEYGIKILKHCSELDMVKQKRNELAHGESRFTEVGGNITESELKKYKEAVYQHLDLVIKSTEKYLKNKEYKKTS